MKLDLIYLGYSAKEINSFTPEMAHYILKNKI